MSGAAVYDSAEVVAGKRMLLVIIGVAAAAILSMIPKPVTDRVELRKRISVTLQDLNRAHAKIKEGFSKVMFEHSSTD
ncbi:hypothetical protein G6F68_018470 [Rhizopus microsporus]|nr:hypothetical protein G6F68_018470 [Rhizopus microsporus]